MVEGSTMQIWPGSAYPLGATYDGSGTNFSIFSEAADAVELCLFDPGDPGGTTGDTLLDDRYAHVARSLLPQLNLVERLTDSSGVREGRSDETLLRALGAPVYQLNQPLRQSTQTSAYYDARDAARERADLARK